METRQCKPKLGATSSIRCPSRAVPGGLTDTTFAFTHSSKRSGVVSSSHTRCRGALATPDGQTLTLISDALPLSPTGEAAPSPYLGRVYVQCARMHGAFQGVARADH